MGPGVLGLGCARRSFGHSFLLVFRFPYETWNLSQVVITRLLWGYWVQMAWRGAFEWGSLPKVVLGGLWVVVSRVMSPSIWVTTVVILLITLLITNHEPPSRGVALSGLAGRRLDSLLRTHMCVCIYSCTHVLMSVCMYVCTSMPVYFCMHMYTHICAYTVLICINVMIWGFVLQRGRLKAWSSEGLK